MRKKLRNESGVTLLELMFASGILAIGLAMLFGSMMSITTVGQAAEQRQVANTCLSRVMEELRGSTGEQLFDYVPPPIHGLSDTSGIIVECFDGDGNPVVLPLAGEVDSDELPNPLEVRVTVVWVDTQGRTVSLSASSMFRR